MQGVDEGEVRIRAAFGEGPADEQDLFRVTWGEVSGEAGDDADAVANRHRSPRFTDAAAIDVSGFEVGHHLRRRHDDETVVTVRHETRLPAPTMQHEALGRMGVDHAEGQRFRAPGSEGGHLGGVAVGGLPEFLGHHHRIAMDIHDESGEAIDASGVKPERHGDGHGCESLCGIEFAADDFLADRGPADFAGETDLQSVAREQAEFTRDQQGRGMKEWDETHAERAGAAPGVDEPQARGWGGSVGSVHFDPPWGGRESLSGCRAIRRPEAQ